MNLKVLGSGSIFVKDNSMAIKDELIEIIQNGDKNYKLPQCADKVIFIYFKMQNFAKIQDKQRFLWYTLLNYYKELLNIDYIFGTNPKMDGDIIENIEDIVIENDISEVIKYL